MEYTGTVHGNVVVLDDTATLPEGAKVKVELVEAPEDRYRSLREMLLSFAGKASGLPSDMSRNHDHYLYGTPKK